MPSIAPGPGLQCDGFDSKDHRRCRLHRQPGSNLCKIHQNYYKGWFSRFRPAYSATTKRTRAEFIFQITHNVDKLPFEEIAYLEQPEWFDIVDWASVDIYVNFFGAFMKHSSFCMLKDFSGFYKKLVKQCLQNILEIAGEPWTEQVPRMALLLYSPKVCEVALDVMCKHILSLLNNEHQIVHIPELHVRLCYIFHSLPEWSQLYYSQAVREYMTTTLEQELKVFPASQRDRIRDSFRESMGPIFDNWSQRVKPCLYARAFKEDLMKVCWHPDRVAKLLDQQGEEFFDMW